VPHQAGSRQRLRRYQITSRRMARLRLRRRYGDRIRLLSLPTDSTMRWKNKKPVPGL